MPNMDHYADHGGMCRCDGTEHPARWHTPDGNARRIRLEAARYRAERRRERRMLAQLAVTTATPEPERDTVWRLLSDADTLVQRLDDAIYHPNVGATECRLWHGHSAACQDDAAKLAQTCAQCGDPMYIVVRAHHHTEHGRDVTGRASHEDTPYRELRDAGYTLGGAID